MSAQPMPDALAPYEFSVKSPIPVGMIEVEKLENTLVAAPTARSASITVPGESSEAQGKVVVSEATTVR